MRIMRVKRFMDQWNEDIDSGKNPAASAYGRGQGRVGKAEGGEAGQSNSNFSVAKSSSTTFIGTDKKITTTIDGRAAATAETAKQDDEEDNRVFMGGIPFNMSEVDVSKICASFGKLKSFNLIKDPVDPSMNKGYAFFEYADERAAEKAIKALNNFEIMDKKLKVQKASAGSKQANQITMHKNVPDEKRLDLPKYCSMPSPVVQFLNMVSVEDLFDQSFVAQVKNDLLEECQQFGQVVSLEIPKPLFHLEQKDDSVKIAEKYQALANSESALVSRAHGKVYVKFSELIAAKQARYGLSGRTYNGRTVVASFYPEHLFD